MDPVTFKATIPTPFPAHRQQTMPVYSLDLTPSYIDPTKLPKDKQIQLSPVEKLLFHAKNTFIKLPQSVYKGLKGDPSFSFSDFMRTTTIPYYLGGTVLTLSFMAAGSGGKVTALRQGIGVGLYYTSIHLINSMVNKVYKWRYGVDLNALYKKPDGSIEKIFASADFPKYELLNNKQFREIQEKMGLPPGVADHKGAVQEQLNSVVSSSRAIKLLLGNLLAAVSAGYIARSDAWARLLGGQDILKKTLFGAEAGDVANRVKNAGTVLYSQVETGLRDRLSGHAKEAAPRLRKSVLGVLGVGAALGFAQMFRVLEKKNYQSPPPMYLAGKNGTIDPFRPSVFQKFLSAQGGRS